MIFKKLKNCKLIISEDFNQLDVIQDLQKYGYKVTDWLALVDGYWYVGRQRSWTWIKLDSARSVVPGSTRSANASVAHELIYIYRYPRLTGRGVGRE